MADDQQPQGDDQNTPQGNDLSTLAITALQNLVSAVNGLAQTVLNAPT